MPDRSSSNPTDRAASRAAGDVVRWLRDSLPGLRQKPGHEPTGAPRIRGIGWRVNQRSDRFDSGDGGNPYVHYRKVKAALQRANLDFAAAVGANASSRHQERMARRVSRLQVHEDEALAAMRRHDRAWSGRSVLAGFLHSDGSAG